MNAARKPLCGARWPAPCEDCVGSCGIEEFNEAQEASAATTLRRVTFEEVNDPRSVWPRGKWQASNA